MGSLPFCCFMICCCCWKDSLSAIFFFFCWGFKWVKFLECFSIFWLFFSLFRWYLCMGCLHFCIFCVCCWKDFSFVFRVLLGFLVGEVPGLHSSGIALFCYFFVLFVLRRVFLMGFLWFRVLGFVTQFLFPSGFSSLFIFVFLPLCPDSGFFILFYFILGVCF